MLGLELIHAIQTKSRDCMFDVYFVELADGQAALLSQRLSDFKTFWKL